MSDEAAFLEALKTNPADDTVRLVYADWLDEHNAPEKPSICGSFKQSQAARVMQQIIRAAPE
ncbi:TIGR02996 domain-containing protein [Gemmata obscuriglobus]|uniref:TIGR02996 domain-containing protein n=1 Tax=Gemmata obscuriglobus TaxID=114 RepID=UPI00137C39E2|nr:TIGR02996 domain-containing protein [Gemmata obscuriglobus]VTS05823.1 unnamed protein product [Gemmata obscuriglobus UQM 2246]